MRDVIPVRQLRAAKPAPAHLQTLVPTAAPQFAQIFGNADPGDLTLRLAAPPADDVNGIVFKRHRLRVRLPRHGTDPANVLAHQIHPLAAIV